MSKKIGWEEHVANWDDLFDDKSSRDSKLGASVRPPVCPRQFHGISGNGSSDAAFMEFIRMTDPILAARMGHQMSTAGGVDEFEVGQQQGL